MPPSPATDNRAQEGGGRPAQEASPDVAGTDSHTHIQADEALMLCLQQGEDAALGALMDRWELGVKNFLRRLGVPDADIDDIAQETFVRVYQKRHSFRSQSRFKPWLLTIAANLGRNRLRWRLRRREQSIEVPETGDWQTAGGSQQHPLHAASLIDAAALSADKVAERNSTHRVIREAITALPDKLRRVLVCVDIEELSYAEAAEVIGCSIKAVESRLLRARNQLRERCARVLTIQR